jgi:hypothetical protein
MASDNREIRYAIGNAADRCELVRAAELRIDPTCADAVAAMDEDLRYGRFAALRAKLTRFHRRRIAQTGRVVASLRPRAAPLA